MPRHLFQRHRRSSPSLPRSSGLPRCSRQGQLGLVDVRWCVRCMASTGTSANGTTSGHRRDIAVALKGRQAEAQR